MKTPNPSPLVPQGTLPDNRGKSRVQFTVLTILAVHAVVLGVVLLQGCKRTSADPNVELQALATNTPPPEAVQPPPISIPAPQVAQVPSTPVNPPPVQVETQAPPPAIQIPAPADQTSIPSQLPGANGASQHVVVKGDTFSTIAKKYGVTTKAVAEANAGVDATKLKIGQKLAVPAPTRTATGSPGNGTSTGEKTYVVKSGDTLFKIAKNYGVSAKTLRTANHLRTDQIKVGQKLVIPTKGSAPMEAAGGTGPGTSSQANPLP
ncbi:MAG TPA: LysM peptidoglycan-binding domain-containing protein [Verrucomicrobiae bacterium]|nr:LysM peptidoglycan-binding domain-containing protein [Verrucomicrobiae bacterium]